MPNGLTHLASFNVNNCHAFTYSICVYVQINYQTIEIILIRKLVAISAVPSISETGVFVFLVKISLSESSYYI